MATTNNYPRVYDPAKAGLLNTMLAPTQLIGTAQPAQSSVNTTVNPLQNIDAQLKESQESLRLREENKAAQAATTARTTGAAPNSGDFNALMSNFMQSMQALAPSSAPTLDKQAASANAMSQQAQLAPDLTQDQLNRISASWHAQRLIEEDSPLLAQAQNRAAQGANARGLLNSTTAINAGTQAMLAEAGNFGKADAQAYGQVLQSDRANDARARETYANAAFEDARSQRANEQSFRNQLAQSGTDIFQGLINNELALERDARQNAFTLERDELGHQLGVKRAAVDAELQAARDAVLYAQQMGRDATQAEYARLAAAQEAQTQLERDTRLQQFQVENTKTAHELRVEIEQLASGLRQKESKVNAELQAARDEILHQQQMDRDATQAQYARLAAAEDAKFQLERDALALENELKLKELEYEKKAQLERESTALGIAAENARLATMHQNQLGLLAAQDIYSAKKYDKERKDSLADTATAAQQAVWKEYQAYNQKINTDLSRDIAKVRTSGDTAEVKRAQIKALQDAADSAIDNNNTLVKQNPNWVKEWALYDFVAQDIEIADDPAEEYDFKDILGSDGVFSNDSERMAAFDEANRRGLTLDQMGAITKFPVSDMRAWLQSKGLMLDADAKRDGVSKPGDGTGPIGGGTGGNPTLTTPGGGGGGPITTTLNPVEPRPTTTNPGTGGLLNPGNVTVGAADDPNAVNMATASSAAKYVFNTGLNAGFFTADGKVVPGKEYGIYVLAKSIGLKGPEAEMINEWARANGQPELK